MNEKILDLKGVTKSFNGSKAVEGADLFVGRGEVFALVGESGSGKTTLSRIALGLITADSGSVHIFGKDIKDIPPQKLRKDAQIVFQDPVASLDPKMRIRDIIAEPLTVHKMCSKKEFRNRSIELLLEVGLSSRCLDRYPHEISGGEAQRISIARALSTEPSFVILDEPVSSVDHSLQKVIVDLLMRLKAQKGLTYLFITHDLLLAKDICDRIAVMKSGKIIETGAAKDIFLNPRQDYTKQLMEDSLLMTNA